MPETISSWRDSGWASSCCGTAGNGRRISRRVGPRNTWHGSRVRSASHSQRRRLPFWTTYTKWNTPPSGLQRIEKNIDDAIAAAPAQIQQVVQALQALRGVGKLVAV